MATSKISERCVFICLLGLTSVTLSVSYVTPIRNSAVLSYSMPVGQTTKNGKVQYNDTSYNGLIINGFYKGGTGILTDRKFGPVNSKEMVQGTKPKGEEWAGWTDTQSSYIDITFEFSGVRKFTNVILFMNVDKKRGNAVFNRSQIFFSSTKDSFSNTSFLQCYPRDSEARNYSYNALVILSLCENTARFMKLRLYFGGTWLLISEISFDSVAASGNEKKSLQNCSGDTSIVTRSSTTTSQMKASTKSGYIETTNSILIIFMGAGVTLAIVLIVLFVILIIYKRRRQASKSAISVDRHGLENQAAEVETESPPNNNQELDHVGPNSGRTAPYEEVEIVSPSSVYEVLSRNSLDGREATNSDRSWRDVIPANGRTSPYSVVQIISPPSVHEMLNRNRPDRRELETANSDRSSAYVIPANGRTSPYSVVQIVSPPFVHDEHNSNQLDGRETANYDCSSGYEKVQISSLSGYTQLDKNRADETNDHTYQKLLKRDSDYLIPTHAEAEPSYVEDGEIKTTPGYTELDNTKRVQDDSASYQKLIKK
ncbi:Hypothetical predicted protein [Paramuricea clavata]|uniref:Discoidin domain-containing protein n=1 Tax=Paramuricea clavata TaxID=317549 RepID=A0A7D9HQS0_PARCT|nr:Hypothetical predicted protein [Paramuricea clavata]